MRHASLLVAAAVGLLACGSSGNGGHTPLSEDSSGADDTASTPHHESGSSGDTGSSSVPEALPAAKSVMCHVDEAMPVVAAPPPSGKPGPKNKPTPAGDPNPPTVTAGISIAPKELMWRIDEKRVGDIYAKVIDADFKEKYKKVQVGPDSLALDSEVQQQKDVFRRSLVDFGAIPTGVDASALKGEYTYNNNEGMMRITRNGKTRDFFFIQHKLWKIVDELPLGENEKWGKDYAEAVVKISAEYGVPGRICDTDYEHNRVHREVDWRDANTQVRAVEWDATSFALIFVDLGTVNQLASWRTAKPTQTGGVDPSVADIMHTPEPPPTAKPKDKDKDKPKK